MDIKWQTNAIRMLRRIADTKASTSPCVAFIPQKKIVEKSESAFPLKRATPESLGVKSEYIEEFLNAMEGDEEINLHTLMIVKDSNVIFEGAYKGYSLDIPHVTHSACKTITALAIGIMIDEGLISENTKIVDIFGDKMNSVAQIRLKDMEVYHLLTMSSGVSFNDTGLISCEDWAESFLDSRLKFNPGEGFMYNSMNSYMLSCIVKRITDEGLSEFLNKRLFSYMGIKDYLWEKCPKGIEKGGWGLYMLTEDMAKLGILMLNKGKWCGRQLVSEEWIEKMISHHKDAPLSIGDYNYGFHVWRHRKEDGFLFNGMFGQNVFGFLQSDTVVVITSGNDEFFQNTQCYSKITEFFAKDYATDIIQADSIAYERLKARANSLERKKEPLIKNTVSKTLQSEDVKTFLNGKHYDITGGESVSLVPLVIQLMSNNYTHGLSEMWLEYIDDILTLNFKEGARTHSLPLMDNDVKFTALNFSGDEYKVSTECRFTFNENDDPVLFIKCNFCEMSNTREIKLVFYRDSVDMFFKEAPGEGLLQRGKSVLDATLHMGKFARLVVDKAEIEALDNKTKEVLCPQIKGTLK